MGKERTTTPTSRVIWLLGGGSVLALLIAIAWSAWIKPPPLVETPPLPSVIPAATSPAPSAFTTSEGADAAALARFASEQLLNGSWLPAASANLPEPELVAVTETTALVLLAYQSAGQTQKTGKYKDVVRRGYQFLLNAAGVNDAMPLQRMRFPKHDSTHRSQALATLALCELYPFTHDDQLAVAAQQAINQICDSQHIPSGVWLDSDGNNVPNEVIYWQLLALRQAHLAYLKVPAKNIQALQRWFQARPKTTAPPQWDAGLLMGLRAYRRTRREELEPHYAALSESSFQHLSLEQKYFAAKAFGDDPSAASPTGLKRLSDEVRSHLSDKDIGQAALTMMILKVRVPKMIFGRAAAEDDFPL